MDQRELELISSMHSKHALSMACLTYRRIGDAELSEDLVQETFLIACCKPDEVYNHENPEGWLYSTLKKLTMREMTKAYRSEVRIDLDDYNFADEHEEPELFMESYILQGLSDSERELILWRVDEGRSFKEISDIKGISEMACRKRVSRAFMKCRKLLIK